ncbi:hypothetical protein Plhal304r1_c024g0083651 [Plasmopara halstedii]
MFLSRQRIDWSSHLLLGHLRNRKEKCAGLQAHEHEMGNLPRLVGMLQSESNAARISIEIRNVGEVPKSLR